MSRPDIKLEVAPGYERQNIRTGPPQSGLGYIKEKVLKQWLSENDAKVGTKWDYAVCLAATLSYPQTNASHRSSTMLLSCPSR